MTAFIGTLSGRVKRHSRLPVALRPRCQSFPNPKADCRDGSAVQALRALLIIETEQESNSPNA
jgi:hypothetical protein